MTENISVAEESCYQPAVNTSVVVNEFLPSGFWGQALEPMLPNLLSRGDTLNFDPSDRSNLAFHLNVVGPTSSADITWDDYAVRHPEVTDIITERWLSPARARLSPIPPGFEETRHSWHQLAFFAIAPVLYQVCGKMGLRYTYLGFGTPYYSDTEQIRVEGSHLILEKAGKAVPHRIATVLDACDFLNIEYQEVWYKSFHDAPTASDPSLKLVIAPDAATVLADWFGFCYLVLETVRQTPSAKQVSRTQLWPEHFDPAIEMGLKEARASYGGSPGDVNHPEPYLYVAPHQKVDRIVPYWNDPHFGGASLSYAELLEAEDPFVSALNFLQRGQTLLNLR